MPGLSGVIASGALVLSGLIVVGLTITVYLAVKRHGSRFWDFIREKDFNPSMARFQFLLWTWVTLFSFLSVVLMKSMAGSVPLSIVIPQNLLLLMGTIAAPTAISSGINQFRYRAVIAQIEETVRKAGLESPRQLLSYKNSNGSPFTINFGVIAYNFKDIPLSDIFREEGKPAVTRFQVFVWTIIAIITYFVVFGLVVVANLPNIENLSLPDVDPTMVTLMGLSQGGYIAGKMAKST